MTPTDPRCICVFIALSFAHLSACLIRQRGAISFWPFIMGTQPAWFCFLRVWSN